MELREILEQYGYEEDTPIVRGSALGALNGVEKWVKSVETLMDMVSLSALLTMRLNQRRVTTHTMPVLDTLTM